MSKFRGKKKTIFVSVLVLVFSIFLSACQYYLVYYALADGYDIDRIIYTDNVSKYISGKTLINFNNNNVIINDEENSAYYAYKNSNGSVDLVIDTSSLLSDESGQFPDKASGVFNQFGIYQGFYGTFYNVWRSDDRVEGEKDKLPPDILNSHKYWFSSGGTQYIKNNYTFIHSDPNCTCGETKDGWLYNNYVCGCYSYDSVSEFFYPTHGNGGYYEEGETIHIEISASRETIETFHFDNFLQYSGYEVEELHNPTQEITKVVEVYILKKYYIDETGCSILGTTQEEYRNDIGTVLGYGEEIVENDTTGLTFDRKEYDHYSREERTFNLLGNIETLYKVTFHDCHLTGLEYGAPSVDFYEMIDDTASLNNLFDCVYHFTYNELVIDGMDFSWADSYIDGLIEDAKARAGDAWDEWDYESLLDLNNYSHMFDGVPCTKITLNNVKGLKYEIKDLSYMFANCKNLVTVDFGNFFDEVKPTDVSYMFYNCPKLQYVDISGLDTTNVTNMSHMFDTNPDRDSIIDQTVNTPVFKQVLMSEDDSITNIPTSNNGKLWILDSLVDYLASSGTEPVTDRRKQSLKSMLKCYGSIALFVIGNNSYPLGYDEFVTFISEGECITLDEYLEKSNAGLAEGEKFTLQSLKLQILEKAISYGLQLTDDDRLEELSSYMQGDKVFIDDETELDFLLKNDDNLKLYLTELGLEESTVGGETWTISALTTELGLEKSIVMTSIKYKLLSGGLVTIKFTFDEASIIIGGYNEDILTLNDLWADFQANPSKYDDLNSYNPTDLDSFKRAIKSYFFEQSEDDGLPWIQVYSEKELIYKSKYIDINGVAVDRNEYIDNIINTEFLDHIVSLGLTETNNGELWTWNTLAEQLFQLELDDTTDAQDKAELEANKAQYCRFFRSAILYEIIQSHAEIPIKYDEIVVYLTGGDFATVDEYVEYANNEQEEVYYTREKLMAELESFLIGEGIANSLLDKPDSESVEIIVGEEKVLKQINTTLVLGGEGSKFVIKRKMDTTDMFKTTNFTKIVAPSIENGKTIVLPTEYYCGALAKSSLTFKDSNKTFTLYYESIITPDDSKETNVLPLVCVLVVATVLIGVLIILISKKKNAKLHQINSDKIFEKAICENKKIMLILDSWTSQRDHDTFARYVRAIQEYYGDDFVYYYKGEPNSPINTSTDKEEWLKSLELIDVNSRLSTVALLTSNKNIYCCGYNSTVFQFIDSAQCGAIFDVKQSSFKEKYKNKVEFFITTVSTNDEKYGKLAFGDDSCVLEFVSNDRYDIAIYIDSQKSLKFYKHNGLKFVKVKR